jgi:hypothetical protein
MQAGQFQETRNLVLWQLQPTGVFTTLIRRRRIERKN